MQDSGSCGLGLGFGPLLFVSFLFLNIELHYGVNFVKDPIPQAQREQPMNIVHSSESRGGDTESYPCVDALNPLTNIEALIAQNRISKPFISCKSQT